MSVVCQCWNTISRVLQRSASLSSEFNLVELGLENQGILQCYDLMTFLCTMFQLHIGWHCHCLRKGDKTLLKIHHFAKSIERPGDLSISNGKLFNSLTKVTSVADIVCDFVFGSTTACVCVCVSLGKVFPIAMSQGGETTGRMLAE